MSKQSSVEWYINNLIEILGDEICNKLTIEQINKIHNLGNQAVAMHKEEQREDMIGLLECMNEIAKTDPMRLETDKDDIVDMYYKERFESDTLD
jgi:hypothetical protein